MRSNELKKHFWYKVLERKLPPDRRKILIVAPDVNDTYHAYIEDIGNIFDVHYLEYDEQSTVEDNLIRIGTYVDSFYHNGCSEWRHAEAESPLEALGCMMANDA